MKILLLFIIKNLTQNKYKKLADFSTSFLPNYFFAELFFLLYYHTSKIESQNEDIMKIETINF